MILLTGSTGFIGRNIVEQWGEPLYTPTHAQLDLTDSEKVKEYLRATKPDRIIHCASNDRDICLYDNLRMFNNLAESGIPMIIFCTGREIEDRSYKNGEYVLSKNTTKELALNKYNHIGVLQIWGCFGYHEKVIRFFMNNMIRLKEEKPIIIKEDRFFSYVYVKDVVQNLKELIKSPRAELFQMASYTKTFAEYAEILKSVTNIDVPIEIDSINMSHSYVGHSNCEYQTTQLHNALTEMWNRIK